MLLSPGRVGRAGVVTQRRAGAWSPSALFTFGEQGAWYDPSDINLAWRRNLLTYTEQFDNAAWAKTSLTAANTTAVTDPIGGTTADTVLEVAAPGNHIIGSSAVIQASTAYTFSVYLKVNGRFRGYIAGSSAAWGSGSLSFNLNTESVSGTIGWSGQLVPAGGGWYRLIATRTTEAVSGSYTLSIIFENDSGQASYTGDAAKGFYVWGAQLEVGTTASAYQQIVTPEITYLTVQALPVMYQDVAGSTPVTAAEQPVGLILDKSRGLTATTASTPTTWVNNGFSTFTPTGTTVSVVSSGYATCGTDPMFTTVNGATYRVVLDVSAASAAYTVYIGTLGSTYSTAPVLSGTGRKVVYLASTVSSPLMRVCIAANVALTATFTIVSIEAFPGNHASQSTAGSRPTLSARYNLLTQTEDYSNAVWAGQTLGVTFSGQTATFTGSSYRYAIYTTPTTSAGQQYTLRVKLHSPDGSKANIVLRMSNSGNGADSTSLLVTLTTTPTVYTISRVFPNALNSIDVGLDNRSSIGADQLTGKVIATEWDLRVANEPAALPAYQRVTTSTDYDTVGFPPYLRFDGSDDSLATASIDFSAGPTNPPVGPELVTNGDFSNGATGWTLGGAATVSGGRAVFADSVYNQLRQAPTGYGGKWYVYEFDLTITSGTVYFRPNFNSATDQQSYTTGGRKRFYAQPSVSSFEIWTAASGATGVTIDNISVREVPAAYAPDKMSVFAGVRYLALSATSVVAELSASLSANNGTFLLYGENTVTANFASKGTFSSGFIASPVLPIPSTLVQTGLGDISGDSAILRLNAAVVATSTADQGTGTYGNYPLFIGRRNNASLPFNGRLYSLIVRGAATSAADINNAEGYVETKTFGKDMNIVYVDEVTIGPTNELVTIGPSAEQVYVYQQYV